MGKEKEMEYKWGIIGAGRFADNVFAPAIKKSPNSRLFAVMARDKSKAEEFAKKHNAEKFYDDAEQLCKDENVDLVYVSTPTYLHCQDTIIAAENGNHVFCEKPMAMNLEECDRMIEACQNNKVTLMIGHNMRFHLIHQKVKEMVKQGKVGKVVMAKAEMITSFAINQGDRFKLDQFRLSPATGGGGAMFDMGIHCIDVLRYILDSEVEEVSSYGGHVVFDCEAEDTAVCLLKFKNGVYGSIGVSGAVPYDRGGLTIYGDKGAITTDGSVWIFVKSADIKLFFRGNYEIYPVGANNCYVDEIEHFVHCIEEKKQPIVDGEVGKRNIGVELAIFRSMKEGGSVRVQ